MKNNRVHKIRAPFLIGGEGQSEQPFAKWLQELADMQGIFLHLKYKSLDGGGYESMYNKIIKFRQKASREVKYSHSFLLIDSDRSDRRDCPGDWDLKQLKTKAAKNQIQICVQYPNHEGLLFRILSNEDKDKKMLNLKPTEAKKRLKSIWQDYEKPVDALMLSRKLSPDGLMRAAHWDKDLKNLLTTIGLISV